MAFPDGIADFRSDTVTRPTAAMRTAMAGADVGDDVYGEDPTVNALEETCAAALGMEAGVFVPSGMMGNALAINTGTNPGDEIVCVASAHIRNYERGAASALSGVAFRTVDVADGTITANDVDNAVLGGYGYPRVSLLAWEITHNPSGGTVVDRAIFAAANDAARKHDLGVHVDGARLWNAVAAGLTDPREIGAAADTVMFCFSKGLGAPVGSILCGDADRIEAARALRKRLGGGMRQVGVIAAAARVGFEERERLVDDHDLARRLVEGLTDLVSDAVDPAQVVTNMVLVRETGLAMPAAELIERLAAAGVKVGYILPGVLRFVTHRDVDGGDVDRVLRVVAEASGR